MIIARTFESRSDPGLDSLLHLAEALDDAGVGNSVKISVSITISEASGSVVERGGVYYIQPDEPPTDVTVSPAPGSGADYFGDPPPSPPTEATTPPPPDDVTPPPPPGAVESVIRAGKATDGTGVTWDAKLHSDPPTQNKDGTWRKRRGRKSTPPPPPSGTTVTEIETVVSKLESSGVSDDELDSIVTQAATGDPTKTVGGMGMLGLANEEAKGRIMESLKATAILRGIEL